MASKRPWIPAFARMSGEGGPGFPAGVHPAKAEAGMRGEFPPSRLRRHLLHEGVGVGRRHVDLGAADVGIERLEHGIGGVGGFAGKAAVAGKGRQAGLDRLLVERRVAERVIRRHDGGDLLPRSGAIHLSARTKAFTSAWVVRGFSSMKARGA